MLIDDRTSRWACDICKQETEGVMIRNTAFPPEDWAIFRHIDGVGQTHFNLCQDCNDQLKDVIFKFMDARGSKSEA